MLLTNKSNYAQKKGGMFLTGFSSSTSGMPRTLVT